MAMLGLLGGIFAYLLFMPSHEAKTVTNAVVIPQEEPRHDGIIRECHPRNGWGFLFPKIHTTTSKKLKIAFLGGSITGKDDCWRPQTMELFRRLYPHIAWEEINASVGGTGSDFGAFRLRHEVVVHNPDLIFVEFAVNDGAVSQAQTQKTMEGIVRQVRRDAPKADMVFAYTIREDSVAQYDLTNATFPRSIAASEVVADHYGIPTIHLGMEIIKLANLGRVKWRQGAWASKEEVTDTGDEFWFGSDGVHPHAWTGCKEYTMAIERCLPRIDGRSLGPGPTTLSSIKAQYPLPEPLDPRNYENATWVSPDRARLAPGIAKLRSTDIFPLRDLGDAYRAQHPGDTFTLDFWGSYVGIYSLVGPFSGTLLLTLDGGTPRPYSLFSTFNHYNRPAFFPLFSGLSVGPHTLVLDVSPDIPDKVSIMASKNRTIPAEAQVRTDCVVLAFCVL